MKSAPVSVAQPKARVREVGLAEIGAGQRGVIEVRVREVLAGEVAAAQVVAVQADPGQIVGLVAGRRIELGERQAGAAVVESRLKFAPCTSAPVKSAPVSVA